MTEHDLLERRRQDAARGARLAQRAGHASRRRRAGRRRPRWSSWSCACEPEAAAGVAALPRGDPARARHAPGHPQRGRSRRRRSAVRHLRVARLSPRRAGAGRVAATTERRSRDREDVRRATRPARRARGGAPPARPSGSSAAGRCRRRVPAPGACATRGGDSSHTRTSPSRAVAGSEQARAFDDQRQRRIDGVRLGGRGASQSQRSQTPISPRACGRRISSRAASTPSARPSQPG